MQTDYTRHLEDLHRQTEHILLRNVQKLLINNSRTDEGVNLLHMWETYRRLQGKWNIFWRIDVAALKFYTRRVSNRLAVLAMCAFLRFITVAAVRYLLYCLHIQT